MSVAGTIGFKRSMPGGLVARPWAANRKGPDLGWRDTGRLAVS